MYNNRLQLKTEPPGSKTNNDLYASLRRRVFSGERNVSPLELSEIFLKLAQSQSCGKCVPCRIGISKIILLLEKLRKGQGTAADIELIEKTAAVIADSADCAVGYNAAEVVLGAIDTYWANLSSNENNTTAQCYHEAVRCTRDCPAHVDIPAYVALCGQERYEDAVRLIRKDNPFPSVCGLICEHPCEKHCRRGIIDNAINIRAIKRAVVDKAGPTPLEAVAEASGKKVAVIGGGPAGLTAAYFLTLMGHAVTVFEKRKKLGGMLRYGIPNYRLPDRYLDQDIDNILRYGVKVELESEVGQKVSYQDLRKEFDSVLVTIGGHGSKFLDIPGEDSEGVISAVKLLSDIGDGIFPDFSGKNVVVIGGGNVAMDAVRTSIRLGAATVKCVYRRRVADMPALPEEIEGAVAEGAEMIPLYAPVRINCNEAGQVQELIVQPQIVGAYKDGRPVPKNANLPEESFPCDIVITAIGQAIQSDYFGNQGIELHYDMLKTDRTCAISNIPGVFAGGDCVFGPATVIKAIEAGKVSAANIDNYLGNPHPVTVAIEIPPASPKIMKAWGRVVNRERQAFERKNDFNLIELPLSDEEIAQECNRCLRCDHYGQGNLIAGRMIKW